MTRNLQIPDCYDPAVQEESRQLAYTAKMMKKPRCVCCGERIWTEECLDLEPFGIKGYSCERCVKSNTKYSDDLEDAV